jgi:hypothetical protein
VFPVRYEHQHLKSKAISVTGSQVAVRFSASCTGRALLRRNIFIFVSGIISARGSVNPKA